MARLRYVLSHHLMYALLLHMLAARRLARHIAYLASGIERRITHRRTILRSLLRPKYFLTLLTIVMVHRVMHGSLVLFRAARSTVLTLVVGLSVAACASKILIIVVLLPHQILVLC